jgi:hypothetical protein
VSLYISIDNGCLPIFSNYRYTFFQLVPVVHMAKLVQSGVQHTVMEQVQQPVITWLGDVTVKQDMRVKTVPQVWIAWLTGNTSSLLNTISVCYYYLLSYEVACHVGRSNILSKMELFQYIPDFCLTAYYMKKGNVPLLILSLMQVVSTNMILYMSCECIGQL